MFIKCLISTLISSYLRFSILAPFPTPASLTRQRNKRTSVQVAHSGSILNASVPHTPARWKRQRQGSPFWRPSQRQRSANASVLDAPALWKHLLRHWRSPNASRIHSGYPHVVVHIHGLFAYELPILYLC
jgi:hypothetical protein